MSVKGLYVQSVISVETAQGLATGNTVYPQLAAHGQALTDTC